MAWNFTEQIILKFQEALSIGREKERLMNRYDKLRLKLQQKSKDFSYALRADGERVTQISKEIFFKINASFLFNDPKKKDQLNSFSNRLLEIFIQSIHSKNSERATSIYNAKGIYETICDEVERLSSKDLGDNSNTPDEISWKIFKFLIEILNNLETTSEEILKNYDSKGFEALLKSLHSDQNTAGKKYIEIQEQLIRFLRIKGSLIPESHADEVFVRVSRRILNGQELDQESPFGYFKQTAVNLMQEYQRDFERSLPSFDDTEFYFEPVAPSQEETKTRELENKRIKIETAAIKKCRAEHSDEELLLLDCYFFGKGSDQINRRKLLGDLLKIDNRNLRIRIFRLKEKISRCVSEKLQGYSMQG